jgi:hypothetical protein
LEAVVTEAVHAGAALAVGLRLTDLNVQDVWGRYVALGGRHTRYELASYISGDGDWDAAEHDIAARAINEFTSERGLDHPVAYSNEL